MTSKSKRRVARRASVAAPRRVPTASRPRPVVAPKRRAQPPRIGARTLPAARRLYAYAVAVAVLSAALLIGLSEISAHRGTTGGPPSVASVPVTGAAATAALFEGIPQRGNVLGSPTAPIRLVEYADPQCPYCAQYARDVLPALVQDYVRTGRMQMVFRGLWFLGPDSGTALRTVTAAASQNRFWNVLELLFRNQGAENAWITDDVLRSIVSAAGADATRVFAVRGDASVSRTIDTWGGLARADGVNAVPAFFVGRRGGPLERLQLSALTVPEFRTALGDTLRR